MQEKMQKMRRCEAFLKRELIRNGLMMNFSGDYTRAIWHIAQNIMDVLSARLVLSKIFDSTKRSKSVKVKVKKVMQSYYLTLYYANAIVSHN